NQIILRFPDHSGGAVDLAIFSLHLSGVFINFRGRPNIIPASLLFGYHMFTVGLDTLLYMILIIQLFFFSFDLDLICVLKYSSKMSGYKERGRPKLVDAELSNPGVSWTSFSKP
ncbi:hypothetical protein ACJX0J_000806, partial (mitochondrion) [Zea mays]